MEGKGRREGLPWHVDVGGGVRWASASTDGERAGGGGGAAAVRSPEQR